MICLALIVVILAIDRNKLMCSSISLLDTLNNPTPYCTISGSYSSLPFINTHIIGAVFHYAIVNWALWWFFLVLTLFHKIAFPFHAHRWTKDKKDKYLLLVVVIICEYKI